MYISNKNIRARARHLLDDNIFGKDWVKSVLLNLLVAFTTALIACALFFVSFTIFDALLVLFTSWVGEISWLYILVIVLLFLISFLVFGLLIGPISVGLAAVHLELVRGSGQIRIGLFFEGFKNFVDNMQLGLMYVLHVLLWSILLIVPGIYMSFSYSMIFYVKHDNPDFRWQQCFDESERLMEGNRWRFFKLQFSFINWEILGGFAFFGLGALWVAPYTSVSNAIFYDTVLYEKENEEDIVYVELFKFCLLAFANRLFLLLLLIIR